jgi:carbonic anhydrase
MDKLVRGVHRFRHEVYEPSRAAYQKLVDGQQPHTLFIACSDSRLALESMTQCQPGDIFVLRNAGNLVPPYGAERGGSAATVEYAVAGLGVKHVVVCGHTGCGAVRALLEPASLDNLPETARWLRHAEATRRIVDGRNGHPTFEARWDATVEVNVLSQLDNLRTHPSVAAGLANGRLLLYGWVFDLRTGEVRNYDPSSGRFTPLPEPAGGTAVTLPPAVAPLLATHAG